MLSLLRPLWPGVIVAVRAPSVHPVDLFEIICIRLDRMQQKKSLETTTQEM